MWPLRLGEEKKKKKIEERNYRAKNIMAPLLHRAAIINQAYSEYKHVILANISRYVAIATQAAHRLRILPIVHN